MEVEEEEKHSLMMAETQSSQRSYSHQSHKRQLSRRSRNISRYKAKFHDREAAEFSCCETIMIYLMYTVVIIIPIFWFFCFKTIKDFETGVVLRLGKVRGGAINGGVHIIIPFIDDLRIIDMRVQTVKLRTTSIMCADAMSINVSGIIYIRVINPWPVRMGGGNCNGYFANLAYPILRDVIGKYVLMDLLNSRDEINNSLKYLFQKETYKYGVDVCNFEIKDVLLPRNMQRAIASEAETMRTKQATIIAAKSEVESAKYLNYAAQKMNQANGTLLLRYLHTVTKVASEHHSAVVFPYLMDFKRFD